MQLAQQLPPATAYRAPTPLPSTTNTASALLPTPSALPTAQHANPRRQSHEFPPAMHQQHHHRPSPVPFLGAHHQPQQMQQVHQQHIHPVPYGTKPSSRPGSAGAHHLMAATAAATAAAAGAVAPTATSQPGLYAAPEMEFLHSPTGAGALPPPDPTAHLLGYHLGEEPHSEFLV
jgi:hypothetical protein